MEQKVSTATNQPILIALPVVLSSTSSMVQKALLLTQFRDL